MEQEIPPREAMLAVLGALEQIEGGDLEAAKLVIDDLSPECALTGSLLLNQLLLFMWRSYPEGDTFVERLRATLVSAYAEKEGPARM